MDIILDLRKTLAAECLDYQQLQACLHHYAKPRDKISALLKTGHIIRVKKGLYVLGPEYRQHPYLTEQLANLIYGPSYISLHYALGYYGFIPEQVKVVTSVTIGRSKTFATAVGIFSYQHQVQTQYEQGIDLVSMGAEKHAVLMATLEKAFLDVIWFDKAFKGESLSDFEVYLHEDLRIDPAQLAQLNPTHFDEISQHYDVRKIRLLAEYLHRNTHASRH